MKKEFIILGLIVFVAIWFTFGCSIRLHCTKGVGGNTEKYTDCSALQYTEGERPNFVCKGSGRVPPTLCYAVGTDQSNPDGWFASLGPASDGKCNGRPLCSEIGRQCGLSNIARL